MGFVLNFGIILKRVFYVISALEIAGTVKSTALCPDTWSYFNASCYYLSGHDEVTTFSKASIACGKLNSFLVRIDSPSEQAFVQNLINTSRSQHDFWIGAEDVFSEGTWEWFGTKLKLAYTNWCPNEPNDALKGEDCAAINVNMNPVTNFCWNDYDCNTYHNFVCEKREQPAYKTTSRPEIHNTSPNLIWRTIA